MNQTIDTVEEPLSLSWPRMKVSPPAGAAHDPTQSLVRSLHTFWENRRTFAYGHHTAEFRDACRDKGSRRAERCLRELLGQAVGALEVPDQPCAIVHSSGMTFIEVRAGRRILYAMPRELMCGREGYLAFGAAASRGIITGCCLFSASAARAVGEDGQEYPIATTQGPFAARIARLIVEPWLSLYEVDTIERLSSCLNALLRSPTGYRFIGVHLPCLEYVVSLFDALMIGQVTFAQVGVWCAAVQARGERVMALLTKRIGRALSEETRRRIVPVTPLAPIAAYVRDCVREKRSPRLETALTLLGAQSSLWAAVLAATQPTSWHELTTASYCVGYLQAAQAADLTIAVENPLELPIYTQTKRLAIRCFDQAPALAGLYLHEMVVATDALAGGSLYRVFEDHGRLGDRKEIVHAYTGWAIDAA